MALALGGQATLEILVEEESMANPEWDNYDVEKHEYDRRMRKFLVSVEKLTIYIHIQKEAQWLLDNKRD